MVLTLATRPLDEQFARCVADVVDIAVVHEDERDSTNEELALRLSALLEAFPVSEVVAGFMSLAARQLMSFSPTDENETIGEMSDRLARAILEDVWACPDGVAVAQYFLTSLLNDGVVNEDAVVTMVHASETWRLRTLLIAFHLIVGLATLHALSLPDHPSEGAALLRQVGLAEE